MEQYVAAFVSVFYENITMSAEKTLLDYRAKYENQFH